jgi:hypothetical protein
MGAFHAKAWMVVLCNAINGLAISAVLGGLVAMMLSMLKHLTPPSPSPLPSPQHADNIARVYAHAVAMMVTMFASVRMFNAPVTPQLALAIVLVATSTVQYNMPLSWVQDKQQELPSRIPLDQGCPTPTDNDSECADPTAHLLGPASKLSASGSKRHGKLSLPPARGQH